MKCKRTIKKYRSLADLRAWRTLLAFYEDALEKGKIIEQLTSAHFNFTDASLKTTLRCFELVQQTTKLKYYDKRRLFKED